MSIELRDSGMVGLTRDALVALRSVLFRDAGASAAAFLQEAGYAGGGSLYQTFVTWSLERGHAPPETMSTPEFEQRAAEFFRELGWGNVRVTTLHDSVVAVDSPNWAEADPSSPLPFPGCYLSSGMLADFFGRIAGKQLVSMEVECRSVGAERCRFLIGSAETMQHVYEEMTRGVGYEQSIEQMA
jgi:predicted hydrocarbon binding protein